MTTNISIKQIHARPFHVKVNYSPLSLFRSAKHEHYHQMMNIVRLAVHDIKQHRLLLKQAKISYKLTKGM